MEEHTLRSRLSELVLKSRKALRLYTSMLRNTKSADSYSDMQVEEWRNVNAELLKQLSFTLESRSRRQLVAGIFHLRDRFYNEWRSAETDLHQKHKELLSGAERGDFVAVANLSSGLISLKAQVEAYQAAHHEIQNIIDKSKLKQPAIELDSEDIIEEPVKPARPAGGVVIPLEFARRKTALR